MGFSHRKKIRKNSILCAAIAGFVILSSFTACGRSNAAVSRETNASGSILNFKTEYVGDNSKVSGIVGALTVPEGITSESVELSTKEKPYVVTVNYKAKNGTQVSSASWEYKNAAVMLSLIGNADEITFKLNGASYGKYKDFYSEFHYTRDEAEETLGKDFKKYSDSAEDFQKFTEMLDTAKFGSNSIDVDHAKTKVEQIFTVISPAKLTYKSSETIGGIDSFRFDSVLDSLDENGKPKVETKYAVSTDGCFYFRFN